MKELTQEYLKELLHYDQETGVFIWKERPWLIGKQKAFNTRLAGEKAGFKRNGYLMIGLNYKDIRCHRLAWLYVYGVWPENDIDHINGISSDNRICNLREATDSQNLQNQKKAQSSNKLGILGVSFDKTRNKYVAQLHLNGKRMLHKRFDTKEEASDAYIAAKRKNHEFCTI